MSIGFELKIHLRGVMPCAPTWWLRPPPSSSRRVGFSWVSLDFLAYLLFLWKTHSNLAFDWFDSCKFGCEFWVSRGVSIALLPFWRFDAKGGEVVLLGLVDLQGSGTSFSILVVFICLLVPFLAWTCLLFVVVCVRLCRTPQFGTMFGIHGFLDLSIMDPMEFWNYGAYLMAYGFMGLSMYALAIYSGGMTFFPKP